MSLRRRSVLLRVALLVLVPLIFLIGLFSYQVVSSASSALTLIHSKTVMDDLGPPIANLQQALTHERAEVIVYSAAPNAAAQAALQQQETPTNHAVASLMATTDSSAIAQSASDSEKKAITELRGGLASLPGLRAGIVDRSVSASQAFNAYSDMIAASFGVLEQAIIQEGDATQVLPGIAVIELAVSVEYLQQESALLNGDFAARAFPAADHQAFVRLVGAHRLLYAQSYSYLTPADRSDLNHDVNPAVSAALTAMENKLVASTSQKTAPPVSPQTWNATIATLSSQTERAVGQAEAGLESEARSQANTKLHSLYLTGGLGLAAVLVSLALSLWIAIKLARQLHGLRDSALEMANVRLPDVVRRLRAGGDVDVDAQAPLLESSPDEIGQVKAAFNTAQRTAVEAAVDEARVRRGINDVFRNLARRSQTLLERQMALLDGLERRAAEPDDLENLFRIDHLTTRMRRHAESLIVLAGDSVKRSYRDPVPFVDVLRAAAAEVEDYTRIRVICQSPAALAGPAVADVIHMLAEFLENATIFSPPNTEVRVTGDLVAKGFAIDIEDRGLGLSTDDMQAINTTLANPPLFDLSGSDRLGVFVAAQLARRHGIRVTLRPSAYGGTTAIVVIPRELVLPAGASGRGTVPGRTPSGRLTTVVRHIVPQQSGTGGPPAVSMEQPAISGPGWPPAVSVPGAPEPFSGPEPFGAPGAGGPPVLTGVTAHDAPDLPGPPRRASRSNGTNGTTNGSTGVSGANGAAGIAEARGANGTTTAPGMGGPPGVAGPPGMAEAPGANGTTGVPGMTGASGTGGAPGLAEVPHLAEVPRLAEAPGVPGATGVVGEVTENGLPRRVRQASLAPQLRAAAASPPPADTADTADSSAHSPETARSVMSAFWHGWQRGLSETGAEPDRPQHGEDG